MNTCLSDTTYVITSSVLTLQPDRVTPAFVNITYNATTGDGLHTWYNQGGQCGWAGPACTADAPYDPNTEACFIPSPQLNQHAKTLGASPCDLINSSVGRN
ncbi:MAG: hypothetical protein OQK95_03135 [Gammaproteobacteria bacterium]|nr:hypothetical protein [Gammaproteobacteria bacterium]